MHGMTTGQVEHQPKYRLHRNSSLESASAQRLPSPKDFKACIKSNSGHSPADWGHNHNSPDRNPRSGGHHSDAHIAACSNVACSSGRMACRRIRRVAPLDRFGSARRLDQSGLPTRRPLESRRQSPTRRAEFFSSRPPRIEHVRHHRRFVAC
jgi:hypothetical protein